MTIDAPRVASVEDRPLWWQAHGLSYTATGYGRKIPSSRVVTIDGEGTRARRVYVTIFSNAGTAWIVWRGRKWIVDEFTGVGDTLRPWGPYSEGE